MSESDEIRTQRAMAWERVKGELESIKHTYYGETGRLDSYAEKLKEFIESVEEDGLHQ